MSTHRQAPAISKDPVADNTDTYAFVSPDDPGTVTIISNYLPLEAPFGGPNFFEFGDDVRYEIHIDNDADGAPEITYEFLFQTKVRNPDTFLYNTGPIDSIDSSNWNRRQFYTVTRVKNGHRKVLASGLAGPPVQVSRLGNPLFNEVIVPLGDKDRWNALPAQADAQFLHYVLHPELAGLLPVLYPGVFPNLAKLTKPRADLAAILMTGIPAGIVPGFQNFTGANPADQLRLNMAIPPTRKHPKPLGLVGGDPAGFPNGRRVFDDVVTVELRAIAGATYPLVNKSYTPDAAAALVTDGLGPSSTRYLPHFPYLGTPKSGYEVKPLAA